MIYFCHITSTGNCGDLMSGPYHWFDFGEHHQAVDYLDHASIPADATVIYGGGTLTGWLSGRLAPTRTNIAWGIGSTRHGETTPLPTPAGLALAGVRDWPTECWVPCASCMSPLFDRGWPRPEHEAVLFMNSDPSIQRRYPVHVRDLPAMDNRAPMDEIVPFLASGATVVTNSYHGAYWGFLLGRAVVVAAPYSSKFYGFREHPAYSADGRDWRERSLGSGAVSLKECRSANRAFYENWRGQVWG